MNKSKLMNLSMGGAALAVLGDAFEAVRSAVSTNVGRSGMQCAVDENGEWDVGNVVSGGMIVLGVIKVVAFGASIFRYCLTAKEDSVTVKELNDLQKVKQELEKVNDVTVEVADDRVLPESAK